MVATLDEMMLMKISDQSRKENFGNLAVDSNGLPRAIHITTANVSDHAGASATLAINSDHLDQVTSVLVDGGYIRK